MKEELILGEKNPVKISGYLVLASAMIWGITAKIENN